MTGVVYRAVRRRSAVNKTSDDTNPFERQEPWVYQTSSFDRPTSELDRRHKAALATARQALESYLATGASHAAELEGLDVDHYQVGEALHTARELVRTSAPPWRVNLWLAQLFHALGQPVECGDHLARAAEDGEGPSRTHLLARLERQRGHLERARQHAGRLKEHDPSSARASAELGHVALVMEEAAEARACFSEAARLARGDEVLLREIDQAAPGLLAAPAEPGTVRLNGRCAVLLPGLLRRIDTCLPLLKTLSAHCDLFVCTNESYREAAGELAGECGAAIRIVEDVDADRQTEDASEVGSMKQWFKLNLCLAMVRDKEDREGFRYDVLYKLRTDYHFLHPDKLLDLRADEGVPALVARSDKVFGGPRDLVMPLAGLYRAMRTQYLDKETAYVPIKTGQILRSSDSYKWFGMNFPKRVVGRCGTVHALRDSVERHRDELESYTPRWFDRYTRLFQGHPRMASEICFARHLNTLGTPVGESPGLAGFLLSDRQAS